MDISRTDLNILSERLSDNGWMISLVVDDDYIGTGETEACLAFTVPNQAAGYIIMFELGQVVAKGTIADMLTVVKQELDGSNIMLYFPGFGIEES